MSVVATAPPKKQVGELSALRSISYDWTMHLRSVWSDAPYDSAEIHTRLRDEFQNRLDLLMQDKGINSPLGWLLVGSAGSGKTHFLSICRKMAAVRDINFILIDMTDVRDFWNTVLQGFLDSLQQEYAPGKFQQQTLLEKFLKLFNLDVSIERALELLADFSKERLADKVNAIVSVIRKKAPREAALHQDVVRAILATTSNDPAINAAGLSWLNANPIDDDMRRLFNFTKAQEDPIKIVEALSWMMSLCGPTVLAFDQLDPIVAQLDPAARADAMEPDAEGLRALSIIQDIANGLSAMFDKTYRTLTLVSCLDATLTALKKYCLTSWQGRFEDARSLSSLTNSEAAASLLFPRVATGCRTANFAPPHPTWPVSPAALEGVSGVTPRELLKICESHRKHCIDAGEVTELFSLTGQPVVIPQPPVVHPQLDQKFSELRNSAQVERILEQSTEDERIAPLLIAGCRCLLKEVELADQLDAVVDDFPGGQTTKPLHARVRLINHAENDREQHYCFRALQRRNANAFQARIKGAINGSGIDQKLPFRHCMVLRTHVFPGGGTTQKLLTEYNANGGQWHSPSDDEVRTLYALAELSSANLPGLEDWLKQRKHASRLPFFRNILDGLKGATQRKNVSPVPSTTENPANAQSDGAKQTQSTANEENTGKNGPLDSPQRVNKESDPAPSKPDRIPLGLRQIGNKSELVHLPLQLLEKHTVVLAGAGSGKTVLLKRIIEEAALAGIPSIVIDGANDLATLGDKWPTPPIEWDCQDAAKAQAFHTNVDVVYWTPGRESGNPLVFEPLPDLAAIASDSEELQQAIDAAVDGLASMTISGNSTAAGNKRGLLSSALRYFARHDGGDLRDFIALLSSLPPEAGLGINKEAKLAREMADVLLAKIETNPMLRGVGTGLDPAILFGDAKKTKAGPRISIISLIGLASTELRQQFVYQLGMTLFAWIKKNPRPPQRSLRGLLIVDEARDFIPSLVSIPSKVSLQLLASQARKYHLGLVLATQTPKEIENRIIGNCATHFYGRASSPAAIKTIQEQLQERGGNGQDIATLKAGQFYAYNSEANLAQPVRLTTPMCLTKHASPLDEGEILERAAKSRRQLEALK